jgi:hypothetical protein
MVSAMEGAAVQDARSPSTLGRGAVPTVLGEVGVR